MSSTLNTKITHKADASGRGQTTFALEGNLDNATVAGFQSKLLPVLATKPAQLIFDLADLKYVASAGIRLFFMALKQQKQNSGHVSFVNLPPQIKEVFAIMGSLPDLRIFKDQAELDAYLLTRQRSYQEPQS